MKVVSVIPARGGSKGVKDKNLKYVGGERLVERAIRTCKESELIEECHVSSDSQTILEIASSAGAIPVNRPGQIATDESSTESVLLNFLGKYELDDSLPDILVLVQCTSPFISPIDLDNAIKILVNNPDVNSVFSAQMSHSFSWKIGTSGYEGINHDGKNRLRRQDIDVQYVETGAFYVFRTAEFLKTKSRFIQPIRAFEVKTFANIEIDTEADLQLARILAPHWDRPRLQFLPKVVVTDFDGVHTNDTVIVNENGVESVVVSRSDGYGIGILKKLGVKVLILSSEVNKVVAARANKLEISYLQGVNNKLAELEKWLESEGIGMSEVIYLGNDRNDLQVMGRVGFSVAVKNAHPEVVLKADHILNSNGGENAVRELAELVEAGVKQNRSKNEDK